MFKITQKFNKGSVFDKLNYLETNYELNDENEQKVKFDSLLEHAINTTDYYKSYSDIKAVEDCPVIEKKVIKENYDSFLSTKYIKYELISMTTSGSYVTTFTFY